MRECVGDQFIIIITQYLADFLSTCWQCAVVGGWVNTGGGVRLCSSLIACPSDERHPEIVLSGLPTFDRFWFTFGDGRLKLGRYGNDTAVVDLVDPRTSEINYVGVFTGYGSNGDWKFHSFCGM